jgi:hypothetical protein
MRDRKLPERVLPSPCPWSFSALPEVGKPLPRGGGEVNEEQSEWALVLRCRQFEVFCDDLVAIVAGTAGDARSTIDTG